MWTPAGVHAQVISPAESYYVDPIFHLDDRHYASYGPGSSSSDNTPIAEILVENRGRANSQRTVVAADATPLAAEGRQIGAAAATSGAELRVFRAAIAAVGEYTQFHGGTVELGLAAVVTAINRINGIYERDLAIRLELVANNDQLIYTNAFTDPYSNGDVVSLQTQNQNNLDNIIGSPNYDIGHVFATDGGGLAALGTAGIDDAINPSKAQGASGISPPTGDSFWVDFVAHEVGHQFGARHTWNGDSGACGPLEHSGATAFEPGSGSTIMSYAGLCGDDNLQSSSDPFFHSISLEEILDHVDNAIPNVGTRTPTGNNIPNVDAGLDATIPARTPFVLTAFGSDADSADGLTYSWEQRDTGPRRDLQAGDDGAGPLFRAWPPTPDPTRTFPRIENLLNNTTSVGETLPTTTRDLNFRVTIRDNRSDGGGINSDDIQLSVVDTGSAFRLTSFNAANAVPGRSVQSVTWDVAGTTGNGINTQSVNILLSTDGGLTFPVQLATRTSNDGAEDVVIPDILTSQARIKLEAVDNVFFDISDANLTITPPLAGIVAVVPEGTLGVSEGGGTVPYEVSLNTTPSSDVVVRVAADDAVELSRDGSTFSSTLDLVFSTQSPQTVFVRAIDDTTFEGVHDTAITHRVVASSDPNYPTTLSVNELTVNIADNELAPAQRFGPPEALIFYSQNESYLRGGSDPHDFAVFVESGTTVSAYLEPSSNESLTVELVGVSLPQTSHTKGAPVALPPSSVTESGFYTLRVSGSGTTSYSLQYYGNTALEAERGDTADGAELDITNSLTPLGSGRYAVLGEFTTSGGNSLTPEFTRFNDPSLFVDISATGAPLNLGDEGQNPLVVTVGNSVLPSGTVTVSNNGVIYAGDVFNVPFVNAALPTRSFGQALVPFWDDLSNGSGNVYWQEREIDGIPALIVQWENRPHFDHGGAVSFQVQVFQSGPVLARYVYEDVRFGAVAADFGASATIGYQSSFGNAVRYSFNSASLLDGDVLELAVPVVSDVDEYSIDFGGAAGSSVDIVLAATDGADLTEQSLELLDVDGSTVLRSGVTDPVLTGTDATNYELAIHGFQIPANGAYTIRTASTIPANYAVVVTDSLAFDSEPNDLESHPLRQLDHTLGAIGSLGPGDLRDTYRFNLAVGNSLAVITSTPLDQVAALNTLDPELEIIRPNGTVATVDRDSAADGKNAVASFIAHQTGIHLLRVTATSGSGAYLLRTLAATTPAVTLSVDTASISEAAGTALVSATLSQQTAVPVTIDLGISGTAGLLDYNISSSQIVVPPGATSGSITITAIQDELDEDDETITIEITSVTNGTESGEQAQSVTILDDDEPLGFVVTALSPTDSGFVAEFNGRLATNVLNLYEAQASVLEPADVTLVGSESGPVTGSLVIDPSLRSVTFLKTGGPLVADVYTVTLRSGSDAFQDDQGQLLDGDADGTAGGDFTSSFTISERAAGTVTVELPDFVRGPGQPVNVPANTTAGLPVTISDGTNVRAIDLRVGYDPQLLQVTGATLGAGMPAGASLVFNNTTPGLAVIVLFSAAVLPPGPNPIVHLQLDVPSGAGTLYGAQGVLDVHAVTIGDGNDNEYPVVVDDAVHLTALFGDVSGNGAINANDAAQVARVAAELDGGFAASFLIDPIVIGDISGNGRINATDASRLAQFVALLPVSQIPPLPSVGTVAERPAKDSNGGISLPPLTQTGAWQRGRHSLRTVEKSAVDELVTDDQWFEDLLAARADNLQSALISQVTSGSKPD